MGSSASSTVNQKYDTTIINKSELDVLNKNVNDFVSNTIVKQASACSSSIVQLQNVDFSNMEVDGDFTLDGVEQGQTSALTFDCIQTSELNNDVANGVLAEMTNALKNNFSTEALDKIEAAAEAEGSTGFGATGGVNTDSTVNLDVKFTNITDTKKSIKNIMENSITNNLDMSSTQDCIANTIQNQSVNVSGTRVRGNATIKAIKQTQAATSVSNCVQKQSVASKIVGDVVSKLGVQVDETNSVVKKTDTSVSATATSKNSGLFQSIGEGIGAIFGGMFGGLFAGPAGIICCVICCIIILIGVFFMMSGGGGSIEDVIEEAEDVFEGGALKYYNKL